MAGQEKDHPGKFAFVGGRRGAERLHVGLHLGDELFSGFHPAGRRGNGADFVVDITEGIAVGNDHHVHARGFDLLKHGGRAGLPGNEDEVGFLREDTLRTKHADVADVGFVACLLEVFARGIDRDNLRPEAEAGDNFGHGRASRDNTGRLGTRAERGQQDG